MASERRRLQVARMVQETVARLLLFEMSDPRAVFTTITGVEMNHDLTVAVVRYSVMEDKDRSKVARMLSHASGFIRSEVAKAIDLRTAPVIEFNYDSGAEYAARIEAILDKVLPKSGTEEEPVAEDQTDDPPTEED